MAQLIGGGFVLSLLASKEPEYAVFVRAYSLAVSLLLQDWSEKYDRTNNQFFASMIVAKYREKLCGGDFSLHPQDLTLQAIKATAIPLPDRLRLQVFEESSPIKVQIAFCLAVLLTHNNPQRQNTLCQ